MVCLSTVSSNWRRVTMTMTKTKTKTNTRTKTKTGNPDDEGVTNLDGVLEHSVIQLFVVWLIISSLY